MTLAPGTRLGPYDVAELLGAGGMGEVYRARDPRLGREVAVKVLPSDVAAEPERLQRFEHEAKAVAALNHPHILTVYDVGTDDGSPYVVTELLEGETIRESLTRQAPPQTQVLGFAVQAAQGLAAAHRKGVIHRDLRPESLFVTTDGRLKILDFGLAKLTAPEATGDTAGTTDAAPTRPGVLMGTVAYMSPEQVQALPVDARSDIFSLGVVLHELLSTRHPFRRETVPATLTAILHDTPPDLGSQPAGLPPALAGIVGRCLEKRPEDRFQTSHDLALALEAVLHAPTGFPALQELEERSPYPGLQSFTEKDASVFFGREGEVQELWGRIRSRKLLAVIGPSGVGKTSFIRAGVLANRPPGWDTLVATPGAQPFRSLGRALGPELAGDSEALAKIVDFEDPENAFDLVGRWRRGQEEALLVLDQFEELFTLNPPEVQERFAGVLGRLAKEGDVHVVLSLRDDFLIRCCAQEALAPVLRELTALLSLKPDDLRRALVEPAKRRGYRFEDDALVEEMVESVEGARAALPLLAFALSRLWERRDREKKLLRRESYEAIGGVAGALAQHAEQTLDRIGSERHPLVREVFRNLVTSQGTRAVVDREELLSVFADKREQAEDVLKALVDSRLLTSYEATDLEGGAPDEAGSGPSSRGARSGVGDEGSPALDRSHRIEIAHESLLKAWPRLVRWQAQDEEGALLRDQLKQAAHLWEEKGRTTDLLWTGAAFQEFELWRQRYPGDLTALEEDFAGSMVQRARRRTRVRRGAVMALIAVLAGVAAVIAVSREQTARARDDARAEASRAEASKMLALARLRLEEDPTEALAFATASLELADSEEARLMALRSLQRGPPARETDVSVPLMGRLDFSPDGRWLAVGTHGSEVTVWKEDGSAPVHLPGHQPERNGNEARWASADLLVTGYFLGAREAHVWSMPEARRLRTIDFGASSWLQVTPSKLLAETVYEEASGQEAYLLRSWELPSGEARDLGRASLDALGAKWSCFAPNGAGWLYVKGRTVYIRALPTGSGGDRVLGRFGSAPRAGGFPEPDQVLLAEKSGDVHVCCSSADDGQLTLSRSIKKPEGGPERFMPDPSGRWVLGDSGDSEARLWDLAALPGARPLELRRASSWYAARPRIHPSGHWLVASTSQLTRLTFWPIRRRPVDVVDGYTPIQRPLAFSPDGRWLATTWSDYSLRLWPIPGGGSTEVRKLSVPGRLWTSIAFDPKGRYLFAVGSDDGAWIVPLDGSSARPMGEPHPGTMLSGAAVSPSGQQVATAFGYGPGEKTLRVWEVETGRVRVFELPEPTSAPGSEGAAPTLTGYEAGIQTLVFEDEMTLYTSGDGGVRRWNLETGAHELVVPFAAGTLGRMWMSPDRRTAYALRRQVGELESCELEVLDLRAGASQPFDALGDCVSSKGPHGHGDVLAAGGLDGLVRVKRLGGGGSHILAGHEGVATNVAVSPDLRWVASAGEDNTLRLWPMPELDEPPLHTLPRDELIAKLRSLTNIRAVRDPEAPEGWSIQLDPFPGWKDVPTW